MAYELPNLPYDYDALEPVIDEETMHCITRSTTTPM
jgi:superoxide dismutase